MNESFYDLYNNFVKRAEEKNKEIRKLLENSTISFNSKEMLSFIVSECLMEDVETIYKLKRDSFSARYVDFIIRNMCEQVIEYVYIMKHSELIGEYLGENLNDEWNGTNLFNGMKRMGAARFIERKGVGAMAKDIGEKVSNDDKIALYDIYAVKAELEHHSYFHHMIDTLCYAKNENENKEELDYLFLTYILTTFIKVYDTV